MPRRFVIPITFGGVGLTTKGRRAFFDTDGGPFDSPRHEPVAVERIGSFPSHAREQPQGKTLPLKFVLKSPDTEGQYDALAKIFDQRLGQQTLLVEDCDDRLKRLVCIAQQIIYENHNNDREVTVPLWAAEPILEDNTLTSAEDDIDLVPTNPITLSLRNIGNYRALPTFTARADVKKLAAEGYTRMMEVSYTNRSEFSLTGPGSGTWMLMVKSAWDTAAIIGQFHAAADGRDIAVFVDEVQVPPEKVSIVGFNTATTKVWIEISDAPAQHAELAVDIAAGTLVFEFRTRDHGFAEGDYLAWANTSPAFEEARVSSVDGEFVTVTRSERNTTAGAALAGASIYKSGHHIQIAWGRTAGVAIRPTNPDPPLIDLTISTNAQWFWPTAGAVWAEGNRRAGGWRRILYNGREDVPELRRNRLAAKTALDTSASRIRFADVEPSAARPNYDALEFTACCGVDDVLGAIEYDADLGWPFCFQIIGRDLLGLDTVIFNRLKHETAAAHFFPSTYTNQQETPPGILSAVIFRAKQIIVTTCRPGDTFEEDLESGVGLDLQGFRLDEDTQLVGLVARARHQAAGTVALQMQINRSEDDQPGARLAGPFSGAGGLGAVLRQVCFFPTPSAAFTTDIPVIPAGDFFLGIFEQAGTGNIVTVRSGGSIYARGSHWEFNGTTYDEVADEDLWFALLSVTSDNQQEAVETERTGEELLIDDITIVFDPARTPIVDPRAEEDAYYYETTWTRGADVMTLRFLKRWADAQSQTVTIDVKARTVTDDDNGDDIRQTIEAVNDPWLGILPGLNTVSVQAANGAQGEHHVAAFRSTWV